MSDVSPAPCRFVAAIPILASLDITRSVDFFRQHLGFQVLYAVQDEYGVITRDGVSLHFWPCHDRHIAENTSCRISVTEIEVLFAHCMAVGIVHPNAPLADKPWGSREFAILDPDGNLVTFAQRES